MTNYQSHYNKLISSVKKGNYRKIARILYHNYHTKEHITERDIGEAITLAMFIDNIHVVCAMASNFRNFIDIGTRHNLLLYLIRKIFKTSEFEHKIWVIERKKNKTVYMCYKESKYTILFIIKTYLMTNKNSFNDVISIVRNCCDCTIRSGGCNCENWKKAYDMVSYFNTTGVCYFGHISIRSYLDMNYSLSDDNKTFVIALYYSFDRFLRVVNNLFYKYPLRNKINDLGYHITKLKNFTDVLIYTEN